MKLSWKKRENNETKSKYDVSSASNGKKKILSLSLFAAKSNRWTKKIVAAMATTTIN